MEFKKCVKLWLAVMLAICVSTNLLQAQDKFEIRYLGNMGLAILHHDSAVVIDGLHDFYKPEYLPADPKAIKAMLQKQDPFKNVVAIVVTHMHQDHFDSTLVTDVAAAQNTKNLLACNQVKNLLAANISQRVIPVTDTLSIAISPGLFISLKKIPHVNPGRHALIENYRVEVNWNGFRLIHVGDAAIGSEAFSDTEGVPDILVLPEWFLSNAAKPLIDLFRPAQIIITHITPSEVGFSYNGTYKKLLVPFLKYGDRFIK